MSSVGSNLVRFEVRFGFLRFGRFKVRFLETYWRFGRFEVRLWGSANLSEPFWHELQSDLGIYVGRIFCKTVGVNFWTCFSLKRRRHFSQNQIFQYCLKKLAKILLNGCRKSKFSKILKVRGSVLEGSVWFWKSKPRFGRFEVQFSRGSEVRRFGGSRFGIFRFDTRLIYIHDGKKSYHVMIWRSKIALKQIQKYFCLLLV